MTTPQLRAPSALALIAATHALTLVVPSPAVAASITSLIPLPAQIERDPCMPFPDYLSPAGNLATIDFGWCYVNDALTWSPALGPIPVDSPHSARGTGIQRYLPGGGALVRIRGTNSSGSPARLNAFWSPDQTLEFIEDAFPDSAGDVWNRIDAFDASADRNVIVGGRRDMTTSDDEPLRGSAMIWRRNQTPIVIPPTTGYSISFLNFVSDDGTVAAGFFEYAAYLISELRFTPCVWHEGEGVQLIDPLPGDTDGYVWNISADGSTVVGASVRHVDHWFVERAYRWTPDAGLESLGDPPPDAYGPWDSAVTMSTTRHATLICGHLRVEQGDVAQFVWTESTGMVSPQTFLVDHLHLDLTDPDSGCAFQIAELFDVSEDGRTWLVSGTLAAPCATELAAYLLKIPTICAGDLDLDNDTDVLDFAAFIAAFGSAVPPGAGADLNADGVVDALDFAILAADFGCAE